MAIQWNHVILFSLSQTEVKQHAIEREVNG